MQHQTTKDKDDSFETITEDIEKESLSSTAYYEMYKKQQLEIQHKQQNQQYIPLYQRPTNLDEDNEEYNDDYDEKYVQINITYINIS